MRKPLFTLFVLFVAGTLLTACGGGSTEEKGIEVHQPSADAATQGENSSVYMALHNHGSETDQLTSVSSDAAEVVQLYNGTEVLEVIPLYANTDLDFASDGYHLLLVGLKQELHVGDEIEIILHFRDREDLIVQVPVQEAVEHEHEHQ